MRPFKMTTTAIAVLAAAIVMVSCAHPGHVATPQTPPPSGSLFESVIGVYTGPLNHMEGVRRGSCPMYPSCSQYSRQAVAGHGFINGWVMTMDRLMRCGRDELKTAPRVFAHGGWRFYDPVKPNRSSHGSADPTPEIISP